MVLLYQGLRRGGASRPSRALLSVLTCITAVWLGSPLSASTQSSGVQPIAVSEVSERHDFLRAARRALALGDVAEARRLAIARGSNDSTAAAVLGLIAARQGNYAEAERLFLPAIRIDSTGEAALELGLLLTRLGRPAEALDTLAPIINTGARRRVDVELLRVAEAARALGRFREANDFYRRAAAVAPQDPAINTAWGELFLEKYNIEDAVRSFRTALTADPEWVPAHIGLGRTLVNENPSDAAEMARRAI